MAESSSELIVAFDAQFRYVYVNPTVERLVGMPREALVGRILWDVAPHTVDTVYAEHCWRAMRERTVVEFEAYDARRDRWNHVRCVPSPEGGIIVYARDTTDERRAWLAREEALRALRASESEARRATRVLDSVSEAYVTLDRDFHITYVNAEAARINKKPAAAFIGNLHWEEWPASIGTEFERQFRRAMTERVSVHFLERYYVPGEYDDWIDVAAYPAAEEDGGGLYLVYRDVSERIQRERRERFLAELAERARLLTDPDAVIADAVRSVGEFLEVSRCAFADIDVVADTCVVHLDYCADDTVASIAGTLPMSSFGPFLTSELLQGRAVAINDVHQDAERVPQDYVEAYEKIGVGAFATVPAVHSARLVSVISLHSAAPRNWLPDEVELLRTVVERTWFTVELIRQQRALRAEGEQRREQSEYLHRLIESSPDCIMTLDREGRILSMNEGGQRLMEVDDFATVRGTSWVTDWETDARATLLTAISTANAGGTDRFQGFCPTRKGTPKWWDIVVSPMFGADGTPEQLLAVSRDVTEQRQAEDRERARLTSIFMQAPAFMAALRGPNHVFEMVNPPYYQLIGHRDIIGKSVAHALPEVVEQGFVSILDSVYRTGQGFVGKDVRILLQVEPSSPLEERFIDFSYQPLFDENGQVTGILAHGIDLTDRKRLEQERERLLQETRAIAEREALLNEIGAAVRATLEPDAILRAAVIALGQGLGVDRCYFVRYDMARDMARILPEWRREEADLPPLTGRTFQMSSYSVDRDAVYKSGQTHVVDDVVAYSSEDADSLLALPIRALLRVPIEVGDQMTAIAVATAHEPRPWTQDEVRLVENVAALVRSALESAHVQQRERNIAQQLQDALQPPAPAALPGLGMASYYRPALAEAGVGGDFFDVFPLRENTAAFVVADLSGKGLAAATQVATVRNMLRYALYSSEDVASAVNSLHRALVEHEALTGFATLFVGVYDTNQRTLTYVNCGQEPGLIVRAVSGIVEQMPSTGAVLGGFHAAFDFEQRTVTLDEGDVLALFTDGLTEVGPSRKKLLEVEGVADVLRDACTATRQAREATRPQDIVDNLIDRVDTFAGSGVRDDIALLVGVVSGYSPASIAGSEPKS